MSSATRMCSFLVPNHPCYQLHHTRILNFPILLTVGIYVVKGEFEARICNERFWNELLSQQLPGLHFKVVGCRTHLPKCGAVPTPLYPDIEFSCSASEDIPVPRGNFTAENWRGAECKRKKATFSFSQNHYTMEFQKKEENFAGRWKRSK